MATSMVGIIWRASSRMRVLWRVICSPRRSQTRTRRLSEVAAPSASSSGRRQSGSTSGILASVSASIWLVLAWRLKNLRRSDALADETRNTVWPRRMKKTATGSQAAPVGSSTIRSDVLGSLSARAASSRAESDSRVGRTWRRASGVPAGSTTAVWAELMPRSMPMVRNVSMCLLGSGDPDQPVRPELSPRAHGPKELQGPSRPPHMLFNRSPLPGSAPRLYSGPPWPNRRGQTHLRAHAWRRSQWLSCRPGPDQPGSPCNPFTGADQASPVHTCV